MYLAVAGQINACNEAAFSPACTLPVALTGTATGYRSEERRLSFGVTMRVNHKHDQEEVYCDFQCRTCFDHMLKLCRQHHIPLRREGHGLWFKAQDEARAKSLPYHSHGKPHIPFHPEVLLVPNARRDA